MSNEMFNTLKGEIEEDTKKKKKWKDLPCSFTDRNSIIKTVMLPNVSCRLNTIPIKILTQFFTKNLLNCI